MKSLDVGDGLDEALAIHDEAPPIDLHADPMIWARFFGYDITSRNRAPLPRSALFGHVDIPRMKEGRMGAQWFGLVALPGIDPHPAETCHRQLDLLEQAAEKSRGALRIVRTADELTALSEREAIGGFIGIEGAHVLEGQLWRLDGFHARGVRYLGLLHFSANACGAPAFGLGANEAQGLTSFGRDVIARCEELGIIVDLAHINRRGFFDAIEVARKPMIVSHTGLAGVLPLWRNITDDQIRAVADRGGVIGVIFVPQYLGGSGIDAVVDHLSHIVNVAGEDVAALGSDWDGFIVPTRGLEGPHKLPHLTQAMLRRGMRKETVAKILRHNAVRVLREISR